MQTDYLDFEQPLAELDEKIRQLERLREQGGVSVDDEIKRLRERSEKQTRKIYANLKSWDVVCVARHPQRPHGGDYISGMLDNFHELHGDRYLGDDAAIIGGLGRLDGRPLMVIAQEKGRATNQKVRRNFGMVRPEGYRKARRLMLLAERFNLPVLCLIDTPGAFPGIDAEKRNISEAIASNLALMSRLKTPILCAVVGEGSSGGALGIGVADHLCMLQYATYFVISPEGCANIIWKTSDKAPEAAESMGLTAQSLRELGVVDHIIEEPLGGAHRDPEASASALKRHLLIELDRLMRMGEQDLLAERYRRLINAGNA